MLLFLGRALTAPLISFHNTGKALANAQRAAGLQVTCSPAASTRPAFAFGVNVWYMQRELNRVTEAYPGATPGAQVPLAA
ncbi:hypothetical protein ACOZDF_12385 [Streptomyces griseoincarnatus]